MSLRDRGYMDKILRIDLSTGKIETENLKEEVMKLILGGRGLGNLIMLNETKKGMDPLSPDNPLIFLVGPLNGTLAPTSTKFAVVTKSPLTGTILDSYSGGNFGMAMKFAGYDAIIIKGRAPELSLIEIDNDSVKIKSANHLKGKKVSETNEILRNDYGVDFKSVVIGPAGERMSLMSGIFSELRTNGRGGTGAVMGSKNLKAIVVRGTHSVKVMDKKLFTEMAWISHRMLRMSSETKRLKQYGTSNIVKFINVAGAFPTKNFQYGQFEHDEKLWGETWAKEYWRNSEACGGCPISCTKVAKTKDGLIVDGPEYETVYAVGSNLGISDQEAILKAVEISDEYGFDIISSGNAIGFLMELYEKGMIGDDKLDGIKPIWGDGEVLITLMEKIGKGEGIGALLEKGVKRMSEMFPGSEKFAMHVKGMEMPGYLPRASKGVALSYAISERGACHLHGSPLGELMGGADPLTIKDKAELFKVTQLDIAVIDSAILCYFVKTGITLKEIWEMVNPVTGFEYKSPRDLEKVGERVTNLARLFNLREGFTEKDDTLPERSLHEPLIEGPAKGHTVDLEPMKKRYYKIMGWSEDGIPTKETLERLELSNIIK